MLVRCSSDFVPLLQLLLTVVLLLGALETGLCGNSSFSCPAGSYCPGGVSGPIACPAGAYCTANVSTYTNCGAGTWSTATRATSNRTCTTCTAGNYCTGGSAIAPCAPGSYGATTGLTSCTTCPLGNYCRGGAAKSTCPPTTYGASTGLTDYSSCTDCPAGSYCSGGATLTPCPAGSWCRDSVSQPTACDAGTWSNTMSAQRHDTCTVCAAGFYCPRNSTKPIPCRPEANEFCPDTLMSEPRNCNQIFGYYYSSQVSYYCTDAITQAPCPAGNFCAVNTPPQPCEADQMSDEGAYFCDPCPNKWYTSDGGSSSCSKPTPMMIGLVCMFCAIFLCCCICGIAICVTWGSSMEKHLEQEKQKKIASELAAQKVKEEKARKSHEIDRIWSEGMKRARENVRQDVLDRLMRDLRMDLELRYPQGLEMVPTVTATRMVLDSNGSNGTEEGVPNSSSDDAEILHIRVIEESSLPPMQAYQQFIADQISIDFESQPMRYAILALATKWKKPMPYINVIAFHKILLGIRSMVLESYPLFLQTRQAHQAADPSVEEAPGGVDRQQVALQSIKDRVSEELRLHASTWIETYKISIEYNSPDKGEDLV